MDRFQEHFELPLENPVLVFALILFIILLVPILLNKIRIPGIIGLILAGVLIGPNGLHLLDKSLFVEVFSTIGLLYIMFIAGLELDLNEFKSNRNKSALFGIFTFIIPLAIGFPVFRFFLGYDVYASLLVASMFSTHTLVTYPIVSRLNLAKNQAVAIAVGGTILTDTAVLILLAVIVGAHQGNLSISFWIRLLALLAIFLAFMVLVVPRVAKWFFKKMPTEKYSHFIFILSVVFFAAFLAQMSGVESIIGAFVAGLVLNRVILPSSVLMNRIEFFGNALFIPFFLISVGMLVDISVILNGHEAVLVAVTLTTVAICGKWLASLITQWVLKYSVLQRRLIFGLSNSHAAATLAIILVGFREGIIDITVLNGTILLILVTCVVASLVTERAAKRLIVTSETDEKTIEAPMGGQEHILLPIVNTRNLDRILEFTMFIKEKKSAFPISILTVVPNDQEAERNIGIAKHKLEHLVTDTLMQESSVEVIASIDYNPASGITRTAREIMADIIILGWPQKTGFIEKIIGEKMDFISALTTKTLFICTFERPLVEHRKIVVALPPLAHREAGFPLLISKVSRLSTALNLPLVFSGDAPSQKMIERFMALRKIKNVQLQPAPQQIDSYYLPSVPVDKYCLYFVVSARKDSVSYLPVMDKLPEKAMDHFPNVSKIIIYP